MVVVKFNLQMIHWNCIFWSIRLFWICKTGSQRCLNDSFHKEEHTRQCIMQQTFQPDLMQKKNILTNL